MLEQAGRPRTFLILHGIAYDGDPDHWHHRLTASLRDAGEAVLYPRLPSPDAPRLEDWLAVLRDQLDHVEAGGELIVICHSLGCLLWLHHAPRLDRPADRLLLVSPPEDEQIPPLGAEFAVGTPDAAAVRASSIAAPRLVVGERDPYIPAGVPAWAREAGCEVDELPATEHINPDDGHGPWPCCEHWCRDSSIRLSP